MPRPNRIDPVLRQVPYRKGASAQVIYVRRSMIDFGHRSDGFGGDSGTSRIVALARVPEWKQGTLARKTRERKQRTAVGSTPRTSSSRINEEDESLA